MFSFFVTLMPPEIQERVVMVSTLFLLLISSKHFEQKLDKCAFFIHLSPFFEILVQKY